MDPAGTNDNGHSLVVVAVPSKDDYVWNISSEKVPHMTVLYLGKPPADAPIEKIVEYVGHVANTSLTRFGLSVDRRGTLGPDNADVIFFEQQYFTRKIEEARSYLLKNDAISALYNSVEQYPQWTPHLTLGYPTNPAKPDKREYPGIHWVNFDTLALWTTDWAGIDFPLRSDMSMDIAMSDIHPDVDSVEDFLEHFGVKGMKWGVRKDRRRAAPQKATAEGKGSPTRGKDGRIKVAPKASVSSTAAPGKHNIHSMSDEELRRAINRINMERQYAELTKASHQPNAKGEMAKEFVLGVLKDVASQQAKSILNGIAADQLKKAGVPVAGGKKK